MLLAAAGAALAPPHASRRRGVALRALTADALETKRLQCFSAFDESETRLAMRLIAAAESEEASLADSASEAFASSLARLRQSAFPDAVDAAWRDGELAAWNWTAPLVTACDDIAHELKTVLAGDAGGWDGAEYQAIAADWSFLSLWQGGGFTAASDAMPKTRRALEAAMALMLCKLNHSRGVERVRELIESDPPIPRFIQSVWTMREISQLTEDDMSRNQTLAQAWALASANPLPAVVAQAIAAAVAEVGPV